MGMLMRCRSRNCACHNLSNGAGDEEFEVRAEQGVHAEEDLLARVVTSCGDSNADRDQGAPEAFIGEAADQLETFVKVVESESQHESPEERCRPSESGEVSATDAETDTPWSLGGLRAEQRNDPHIGFIIRQFENSECQPAWDVVALESETVKALWAQ